MVSNRCDFGDELRPDGIYTCIHCGRSTPRCKHVPIRVCTGREGPGIGDRLAAVFAAVGIKECGGCAKRKVWLNKLGRRIAAIRRPRP